MFLDEMNLVVPWAELVLLISPLVTASGTKGGHSPFAVETMLRIHFLHGSPRRILHGLLPVALTPT